MHVDDIITKELGAGTSGPEPTPCACTGGSMLDDSSQALANYIVEIMLSTVDKNKSLSSKGKVLDSQGVKITATTLLKSLQPRREAPNKNRGKRFSAEDIAGDNALYVLGDSIEELQFCSLQRVKIHVRENCLGIRSRQTM